MPEEELRKYIKFELRKSHRDVNSLDVVRMQLEFQVSYDAIVVRLFDLAIITSNHKAHLFDKRSETTSSVLFRKLDADAKLLKPAEVTEVPADYLEYLTSNYYNNYIPFSSMEKALSLIGMDATVFNNAEEIKVKDHKIDYKNKMIELKNYLKEIQLGFKSKYKAI